MRAGEFVREDSQPQRGIRYSGSPNLAAEWDEAERYPEFQKWGHEAWFEVGNRGRVVRWSQLGEVGNHEPNLDLLDPEKVRRVQTEVLRDEIDYPIVGRWPDGYLDLIAGNTRVAVLLSQGYDPKVWLIDIPEDPELDQARALKEVRIDNEEGWGSVPYNKDVDYFGLRVLMRPSTFLRLARPLSEPVSRDDIAQHIQGGGSIGAPFLDINVPPEWDDGRFEDASARVVGHEGRNRMMAIQQVEGDEPVEVHLFPKGGLRRRDLTPEFIDAMNSGMGREAGGFLTGPLFRVMP